MSALSLMMATTSQSESYEETDEPVIIHTSWNKYQAILY